QSVADPLDRHSFPTRRSSDLHPHLRGHDIDRPQIGQDRRDQRDLSKRSKTHHVGFLPKSPAGRNSNVRMKATKMPVWPRLSPRKDRKSTRLNSSHVKISYAVF